MRLRCCRDRCRWLRPPTRIGSPMPRSDSSSRGTRLIRISIALLDRRLIELRFLSLFFFFFFFSYVLQRMSAEVRWQSVRVSFFVFCFCSRAVIIHCRRMRCTCSSNDSSNSSNNSNVVQTARRTTKTYESNDNFFRRRFLTWNSNIDRSRNIDPIDDNMTRTFSEKRVFAGCCECVVERISRNAVSCLMHVDNNEVIEFVSPFTNDDLFFVASVRRTRFVTQISLFFYLTFAHLR